ncbi:hypothetical protein CRUP_013802 [Coryphaenoides rupestris]|nr:hypothetical protein CRUP_013802 [Coryphaenoides rupestris]
MVDVPFWSNAHVSLEDLARKTETFDWYRWLGYLALLLFDVLICLLVLFGLIRNSRGTLIGVCLLGVLTLVISWNILQYYIRCSPGQINPFQQGSLEQIQSVLNSTEVGLHQLTALVDCRSLHMDYIQALTGLCYDGVEGLIYLVLFSFVTALMFSSIVCSVPHTWPSKRTEEEDGEDESGASRGGAHDNLYRVHMPSLYSCGSSYGSEASLPATAHTVSNAPVTEYIGLLHTTTTSASTTSSSSPFQCLTQTRGGQLRFPTQLHIQAVQKNN